MPLNKDSSKYAHLLQNMSLISISLAFIPVSTVIVFACYLKNLFYPPHVDRQRQRMRSSPDFTPRTVLVTGVGMTKGLALARLFYRAGHTVIGADFEPFAPCSGRVSRSITRFYRLDMPQSIQSGTDPYTDSLLKIITREKVDIWVSCSSVSAAIEDGKAMEIIEARTPCQAIQFDTSTTQKLHEKDSFIECSKALGLTVPETHSVTDSVTIKSILDRSPDKFYILKTVGVNDAARSDMTILPRPTATATDEFLAQLPISADLPWIMQEFVRGDEFCTHALVIRGRVRAFAACPSAELLMHYRALASDSPLSLAMLDFTETFARKSGRNFTGHLSFDFLIRRRDLIELDHRKIRLYPIECNPRCHTAVVLFSRTPQLANRYLEVLEHHDNDNDNNYNNNDSNDGDIEIDKNGASNSSTDADAHTLTQRQITRPVNGNVNTSPKQQSPILFPKNPPKVYWLSHDLITLVALPILNSAFQYLPQRVRSKITKKLFPSPSPPSSSSLSSSSRTSTSNKTTQSNNNSKNTNAPYSYSNNNNNNYDDASNPSQSIATFLEHLLRWKEGTLEIWDPLPWWWLNHVYWPLELLVATVWTGKRYSRFNVSTTKKFEC